jgi:hypothetical protein
MMTMWEDSHAASYMDSGVPGRVPSFLSQPDGHEPRGADYRSASAGANRYAGRGSAMLELLYLLGFPRLQPVRVESRRYR